MTASGVRKAFARVFRGVADRLDPPPLRGDNRPAFTVRGVSPERARQQHVEDSFAAARIRSPWTVNL